MVSGRWTWRGSTLVKIWTEWKAAWSGWPKKGVGKPALGAEARTFASHCGRTDGLGQPDRAGQAHARLGAGSRAHSGRKPRTGSGRGGEQEDSGATPGCLAQADGQAPDHGHALGTGADMPHRVVASAYQPAAIPAGVLQPHGFPAHQQRDGAEHSWLKDTVSPHQRAQELERVSGALWTLRCLRGLVGARRSSSAAVRAARCRP